MPATPDQATAVSSQGGLRPLYKLFGFGAAFCLVVLISTAWMVWRQHDMAEQTAATNVQNLARAVADQADRVIESVESAEERLLDHLAIGDSRPGGEALAMDGSEQLKNLMRDISTSMSEAYVLILIDADGNLVNFSRPLPVPRRNLADRQYFQFAVAHPELKSFISETVVNRETNTRNFYVVRRLTGPDGGFAGVLLGAIQVDYLDRLFGASTLPQHGSMGLFRDDGSLLVRHPPVPMEATIGREGAFRRMFQRARQGAVRQPAALSSGERLVAVNDLPRHPLKLAVAVPYDMVMAAWSLQAIWMAAIAALGCLATLITVVIAIRRLRDQQRLEMATSALKIASLTMQDALTGLPNRFVLRARADEALASIHERGSFAVLCLNLDQFKDVNDALGHPTGDKLLCKVAKRILSVTRRTDLVMRLGGDDFAVIVHPGDDHAVIAALAARLVEIVSAPYAIDGHQVIVGASIGIAQAPSDGTDPDMLMKNADLALHTAKNNGRGRFVFFEPLMEQQLLERRRIECELRIALVLGEFELYYQPIVRVDTRRVAGFEALMRWRHPVRGMVPPVDFIPVAEDNGFIIPIGAWALKEACLQAASWAEPLKIAVNLSPVQFRHGNLVAIVAAALQASGLAPHRLELEITESTMMQDIDATLLVLREIKALGVRIAMDDFGTGYSSLAQVRRFPFDKIKIDRAFIRDIEQSTNLTIIRAVTAIAENMGITTTAEGVETEEQFARVANERCNEVQGYLFSPPRPQSEIPAMLARPKPHKDIVAPAGLVEPAF